MRELKVPARQLRPGPEVIKHFSCSTQLSMTFQLLIKKLKYRQLKKFLASNVSDVVFIMIINVKMPTFVGILTLKMLKCQYLFAF